MLTNSWAKTQEICLVFSLSKPSSTSVAEQETVHMGTQTSNLVAQHLKDLWLELPCQYLRWKMECCKKKKKCKC